jgi:hypothetical protein
MQTVWWTMLLLLLMARPVCAGFAGYVEIRLTMQDGAGTLKGYLSSVGARAVVEARAVQLAGVPVQLTLMLQFRHPDVVYLLNEGAKTYTTWQVTDAADVTAHRPAKTYTLTSLGTGTVAGYVCAHRLVTANDGGETEVWTSKALVDLAPFHRYMRRHRRSAEVLGILQALKQAGVEGFLAKLTTRDRTTGAPTMTIELVKAEKRPVAAAMFAIPAGYTKQASLLGLLPQAR